jgi:hypothetical protein
MKSSAFTAEYGELILNRWINSKTRAVITTFTIYIPSRDIWVSCLILVEISVAGNIHPKIIKADVFKPNLFESSADEGVQVADIFRFLFSLYMFYMFLMNVFSAGG